ncbi:MAG: flagellar biosynthesis protein FlhF [Spirochaetales bacterium]|nr:flagellar biosynthesis protein FlhF [Spirochaetales bacterium]
MQYFTIQAKSHREAIDKMRMQHGENGKILTYRNIRLGGFLGMFSKDGVEITGYVSEKTNPKNNIQTEKMKVLETAKKEQTLNYILKELKELKYGIGKSMGTQQQDPPAIKTVKEILTENDFSLEYIQKITDKIRNKFSIMELETTNKIHSDLIDWIAASISIYDVDEKTEKKPKIMTVIGPTGVGKTTTVAKLAALYGLENNGKKPLSVRIITIDNYRIGAKQQIETYGDIMRIPVSFAETPSDLKKLIALYNDVDIILIDTIGKSQKDYKKLAEMKELLASCGNNTSTILAVSATTKYKDLEEILQQYEPFKYVSIIITKLDETSQIGNIISIAAEKKKSISFVTDGQKVPQDIEKASIMSFLMKLEGLHINRELLEKKYGKREKVLNEVWS